MWLPSNTWRHANGKIGSNVSQVWPRPTCGGHRRWSPASSKESFPYRLSCWKMVWALSGGKENTHWCSTSHLQIGWRLEAELGVRRGRFEQTSWKIFLLLRVPEFTIPTPSPNGCRQVKLLGKSQIMVNSQVTRHFVQCEHRKKLNRNRGPSRPRLQPKTSPAFKCLTLEFWNDRIRSSYESPVLWKDVTGINSNMSLIGVVPKEERVFFRVPQQKESFQETSQIFIPQFLSGLICVNSIKDM